jgi:hypothetical protein
MPSKLFTIEFSCDGLRTVVVSSTSLHAVPGGVIDAFEKHTAVHCKHVHASRHHLTAMLKHKDNINKEFRFPQDDSLTFYIINVEQNMGQAAQGGQPADQGAGQGAGHEEKDDEDIESELDEDLEPESKRLKLTTELTAEVGVARPSTVRINLIDVFGIRLAVEKMVSNAHQKYVIGTREAEAAYVQFANSFSDSADIPFDEFQLRSEAVVKAKETYSNDIRAVYRHMLQPNDTLPGMYNKTELFRMSPRPFLAGRVILFCSAWVLTHIDPEEFTQEDLFGMMTNLMFALNKSNDLFFGQPCLEAMQDFLINDIRRELFLNVEILRAIPTELKMSGLVLDLLFLEGTCTEVRLQLMITLKRTTELELQPFFDLLKERNVPSQCAIDYGCHFRAFSYLERHFRPNENEISDEYRAVLCLCGDNFKHALHEYDAEVANGTRT